MNIGTRLKQLRLERNITQKEIAVGVGVSSVSIQRFEYGTVRPSLDTLLALADFFDVPMDYLLGRGIFSNWETIMEKDNLALVISGIEAHVPELKKYDLLHADERKLMSVLSAFISSVEVDEDKHSINITYLF